MRTRTRLSWAVLVFGALPAFAQGPDGGRFVSALAPEALADQQAVIETVAGTIILELLEEAAPNHVAHFITETRAGRYDGTVFHRVIERGIIQGGDPLSVDPAQAALYGTGGLQRLDFEPNDERHLRGAVSAVRVPDDLDSAGAQFFICVSDQPALDGAYTVFARVVEGIAVAEALSLSAADAAGTPVARLEITRVTIRDAPPPEPEPFVDVPDAGLAGYHARIETSRGAITLAMRPDLAPGHVRSFLRLAALGVYDNTAVHRVVPGFVVQGGFLPTRTAPLTQRQEGFVRGLTPELSDAPHVRGTVSLARGDDPASGTTSFFIVTAPTPALDGVYTVFAEVIDGFDVLDVIEAVALDGETPVERIEVSTITILPAQP
jgi:cyclophilin family peptidyl-prolyl cis-trans isomerase